MLLPKTAIEAPNSPLDGPLGSVSENRSWCARHCFLGGQGGFSTLHGALLGDWEVSLEALAVQRSMRFKSAKKKHILQRL